MSVLDAVIALGVGLSAGLYAGLLGVGGGIIMVPALVLALGQDQQVAQGTSLLVIIATAVAGTAASSRRGLLDRPLVLTLGIAGMVGAGVGALVAVRVLDETTLRRVFGAVLILIAVRLATGRSAPKEM